MKPTRTKLPRFEDEDQEREFWATHSALDYFDTSKPRKGSFPNLKPSLKTISSTAGTRPTANNMGDMKKPAGTATAQQDPKATLRSCPAVVRKAIEGIARGYAPRQIWLYGSYARGDFHQGSDLDLIIIKATTRKFPERIEEVLQYAPGGIDVEPLVYTPGEKEAMLKAGNAFLENAFSEGVLVYER